MLAIILFYSLILIILTMFAEIIAKWIIFSRHYGEAGWKAIIPFYNRYIEAKYTFGGSKGWIGLIYTLAQAYQNNELNQHANNAGTNVEANAGFFGLIITLFKLWFNWEVVSRLREGNLIKVGVLFLPIIFWPVVALSSDTRYRGPKSSGI